MFDHHCTACDRRQLIFPSQVTRLDNTDHGIVVDFVCWCGSEQTPHDRPGGRPPPRDPGRLSPSRPLRVGFVVRRAAPYTHPGCPGPSPRPPGQRAALAQSVERFTRNE